jgi:hypothetical protein
MKGLRPARALALVLGVSAAHLALLPTWVPARLGEGSGDGAPRRLAVSFVNELQPVAPPPATERRLRGLPPPPRAVAALPTPEPAASAPRLSIEETPPLALAELAPPVPPAPPAPPAPALASALALATSDGLATVPAPPRPDGPPDATTFDWPPSTRLSYQVRGDVQGPVEGDAKVEWLRQGLRYQVHLELRVALLASRRVSSDGFITPEGLSPRRYDEETRLVLREPRRLLIVFDDSQVVLADGRRLPRPSGVQDSASQFVQMTWLFNARPELLQPGRSVVFPLALPRRIDEWTYDILAAEPITTPAGTLDAVHVKPRREAGGSDLTAEFWVAPQLQHLPVRLLIRQGQAIHLELLLARLPEQEAAAPR